MKAAIKRVSGLSSTLSLFSDPSGDFNTIITEATLGLLQSPRKSNFLRKLPRELFKGHKSMEEIKLVAQDGGIPPGSTLTPTEFDVESSTVDISLPQIPNVITPMEFPNLSECRALVVDEVKEDHVLHGFGPEVVTGTDHLPVRIVKLPVEDISTVAVLSWRWDGDLKSKGSRNIAAAVFQAKKMRIRYLFVDVISIDQHLPQDALVKQVVAFSVLYRTIPVIAAYDKVGESFERTIYRPWIVHEARQFRYNPTKLVYVGHSNKGANKRQENFSALPYEPILGLNLWHYRFGEKLGHIWTWSFMKTIIGVLCNKIGMSCVSDFKFIIPPYVSVLTTAYENMSRNDYLLSAAILCQVHMPESWFYWDPRSENYDRYRFGEVHETFWRSRTKWTIRGIYLDGIRVGLWKRTDNCMDICDSFILEALPNAERVIFTALGLPDSDYQEFVAQEGRRRACLVMETKDIVPVPTVEIVSVKLPI